MKNLKYLWTVIVLITLVLACANDDDDDDFVAIPDRDRDEQQMADQDSLLTYLNTHMYNSGFFQGGENYTIDQIEIVEADLDDNGNPIVPEGFTLLIDAVVTLSSVYLDTEYEYYVLKINQGGGEESPEFPDRVRIRYEGSLITDASVFDSSATPDDFNLVGIPGDPNQQGVIVGWQRTVPEFNIAESFVTDIDGITTYDNYGLGVVFIPSGLGFWSAAQPGIPSYSNIQFKIELYQTEINDHDGDLVRTSWEDLNGNMDVLDDDTDNDNVPDYLDLDDDGDGVLTANEDIDGDGDPTNDIGINGIPKYLDPEETESNEDN